MVREIINEKGMVVERSPSRELFSERYRRAHPPGQGDVFTNDGYGQAVVDEVK